MKFTLSLLNPIASGSEKEIYQYPDADHLLIKVWHSQYFDRVKKHNPILTRLRRLPRYSASLKELIEHLYVREWGEHTCFLQNIVGVVDTDLGVGLVVEKITRKDGTLAQSLFELLSTGNYCDVHEKAIAEMVCWLRSTGLIIRDLSTQNLVWDEHRNRFVIIDGLGGLARCSLREYCRWYNQRSNNRRADKLLKRIEQNKLAHSTSTKII